ncbi:hypothetical protein DVR12_00080 [Chitinophaga silvatica]|uniref:Uncharacterized protein n=1 Tax=Chitinophaga silvatica TaxID=2282649 RepID=A0A3E1YFR2_9BACT|nr:hypothetical protein [Chitinophaga silvatica]RFS26224.1 hypothetical protein DVR12_00080 [Chitinophaga silvatica]
MNPINLEISVRHYLPIVFELLGERKIKPSQWRKINDNYRKIKKDRFTNYLNNSQKLFEVNLYDLFDMMEIGNRQAYFFLYLIKRSLEELCNAIPENNRYKLRDTLYNMLVQFDHKHRNYIGELLVLNNIVKSQQFELIEIEEPITNSTSADFFLRNKTTGATELLEVVNIHIDQPKEDIKKFIEGKLEAKFEAKTKNQIEYKRFTLIPVVWAPYKILRQIEKLYDDGDGIRLAYSLPPCAFASFDVENTINFVLKFGTIPTLFKGLNIQESIK